MSQILNKKSVALYARVSTGNQGSGLEAQIRALRNYCQTHGISHYLLYEDENQSGTKSSRPALDKMMKSVRAGEVSKVIVYSFSRYARSTTHLLNALQEFKKLGVDFISISENIDTSSPLGVAIFSILGAVATLERDILVERVKLGLANAKAKGIKIGRKKTRDSELIRKLFDSGSTYREMSKIAKCSSGAIGAEVKLYKQELKARNELERAMKERQYEAIKDDLEKSKAKVAFLEERYPRPGTREGEVLPAVDSPLMSMPSTVDPIKGEPIEVII